MGADLVGLLLGILAAHWWASDSCSLQDDADAIFCRGFVAWHRINREYAFKPVFPDHDALHALLRDLNAAWSIPGD